MNDFLEKSEELEVEESVGSTIRLSVLLALLSIPNILTAKEVQDNLPSDKAVSAELVKGALEKTKAAKNTLGGYTLIQTSNIVARTIYMEARSEGTVGMDAVASVIYNRAGKDKENFSKVCLKKSQFSCWNDIANKKPQNYKVLIPNGVLKSKKDKEAWKYCLKLAGKMLSGNFASTVGNRNSYHTVAITPDWDGDLKNKKTIGSHVFGYLPEYDPNRSNKENVYIVKKGDNLGKIAVKYNTTTDKLLELNPSLKKNPNKIFPGMKLKMPNEVS